MKQRSAALKAICWFGFIFLYAPIVSLIVYSFNESRLVTVWGGLSTKWYVELFRDPQILNAAWISLKIGAMSATLAVLIGLLTSHALIRIPRFRTKPLLGLLISAPLVLPEVIIGLSLLLLFVALENAIGWPAGRGVMTVVIAHATFGAAFAAVVIQSRMVAMDLSIEEAAQDLGAKPIQVFFDITLPAIAPALIAAWLLAFTLSLDDLVIASFVSGPGASTLPMVIFSKVRLGVSPDVNALATLIIAVVTIGIVVSALIMRRSSRRGASKD